MNARIIKFSDRPTELELDYNEDFLEEFKETIPSNLRHYDRPRQRWIISSDADMPTVEAILADHFDHVSKSLG